MNAITTKNSTDFLGAAAARAGLPSQALSTIRNWLAELLVSQEFAKLGQGGHTNTQIPLRTVFVDLPVTCESRSQYAENREQLLARLHNANLIDFGAEFKKFLGSKDVSKDVGPNSGNEFSAVLLVGGPGQGKSTTGQLASQLYRAALLEPSSRLLDTRQAEVVKTFMPQSTARYRNDLSRPKRILFPLTFELPKVAEWLSNEDVVVGDGEVPILIKYLAELPSGKSARIDAALLWQLAKRTPLFIVLDGFDEVGANKDRELVVSTARQLFQKLADSQNTGQVLATTRPQGYAEELSNMGIRLRKWFLAPLEQDEALAYAKKLVEAKIEGPDLQKQTMQRLEDAAQEPATQRLMSTPLQVTILAALVQQLGSVPRERWNLFSRYFGYTYDREIERRSYASNLLQLHRNHIERIHARVGLLLQVEAEAAGGAAARMSRQRLEEVISEVLQEDEISSGEHDRLVTEIADAAKLRLVFLVEPEPGKFGFEIRSLQEFMSAWALTDGRDDDIVQRMGQVARASMFRNVFVFIASRLYSISSPLRDNIGRLCDDLNSNLSDEMSCFGKAGSLLAMDILEEGAVTAQPRQSRSILERATQLLTTPVVADHIRLATVADRDNEVVLEAAIRRLLEQPTPSVLELEACWNCLSAADALGQGWAFPILSEHIEKFYSAANFRFSHGHTTAISTQLQRLLESNSANISAFDLMTLNCVRRSTGEQVSWLAALTSTLGEHSRRYRRLMLQYLGDRLASNAPLPPASPPPAGWEDVAACVRFETSPSVETLAAALRTIAVQTNMSRWHWLSWHLSWPMAACLNSAKNADDLKVMAGLAEAGSLGSLRDWLDAEKQWPTVVDPDDVLVISDGDLPWNLKTLSSRVPLMALPAWVFRFEKKRKYVTINTMRRVQTSIDNASNSKLRERLAEVGINLLPDVAAKSVAEAIDIPSWIRLSQGSATILAVRPSALSVESWKSVIDTIDVSRMAYWGLSIQEVLSSAEFAPWHSFSIYAIGIALDIVPRQQGRRTMLRAETLASARSAWAPEFKPDLLRDARSISIGYLFGFIPVEKDQHYIENFASEANENRWKELLGALYFAELEPLRMERILTLCAKHGASSVDVAHAIRERLQSRRTSLELPGVWTRLSLPLPRPNQSPKEAAEPQLKQEKPVHVNSLVLKDVGRVDSISIQPISNDKEAGQWVVILGPNGCGKTTLLKSIALSLRNLKNPAIWPRGTFGSIWRRVMRGNTPAHEGLIEVGLEDGRVFETRIFSDDASRSAQLPARSGVAPFSVFAYGCRRGSALGGGAREININADDGPEISTLFDESQSLIHAETWLVALEGDAQKSTRSTRVYGAVVDALKGLLQLEYVGVSEKRVWVKEAHGPTLHLSSLSDGYLTTAGWFIDLIARWVEHPTRSEADFSENFLRDMVGLVLIDELDLHLHPKWQIDVISRTKNILPRMSFWVTTHNPLCLVGAKADEIWIMEKEGENTVIRPGKEAPLLLTGSQLFKKYFGIGDIYPDELGRDLQRYSFLHSYSAKSQKEERELKELEERLRQKGVLPAWH